MIAHKYLDCAPIKFWTEGVPVERAAEEQLANVARLPFIYKHIAVMPDVHLGKGATVGSVIPTTGAVIPAAVGVDIGCGMMAIKTDLTANDLPDSLSSMRYDIESLVPVGNGPSGSHSDVPAGVARVHAKLYTNYCAFVQPYVQGDKAPHQLGTLGGGNHFIEVCLDEADCVWVMLHSGSRGIGNKIGTHFIALAKEDMRVHFINLPDKDLAYLAEGTKYFDAYIDAVSWAQEYAKENRHLMMGAVLRAMASTLGRPKVTGGAGGEVAVQCHHNYISREHHFGRNVWVTRKGAVDASAGKLGIIPGSMGKKSYIVRGKGNEDSFRSCSHGAGRAMSRTEAKRRFTVEDHVKATEGVECRKDAAVIDETPAAYKDLDAVMEAQKDLVDVVHTLRAVLCVKG